MIPYDERSTVQAQPTSIGPGVGMRGLAVGSRRAVGSELFEIVAVHPAMQPYPHVLRAVFRREDAS